MTDDVYAHLRHLLDELKEFGGLEQADIAERTGMNPTTVSRFLTGQQETLPYDKGRAIEALYQANAELIKTKKIDKLRAIEASLQ